MSFREGSSKSTDDSLKNAEGCKCPGGDCGQGCTNGCNNCNCDEQSTAGLKIDHKLNKVSPFNGIHKTGCLKKKGHPDAEQENGGRLSLAT